MKIYTHPKEGIIRMKEQGIYTSEDALISILSTVDTPLSESIKSSYKYVLELRFDDLPFNISFEEENNKESDFYGMTSFNYSHYARIYKFVKGTLKDFDGCLRIHCTAGISRSGAVAVGVSLLKEDKEVYEQVIKDNNIIPNQLVLSYFIQGVTNSNTYFFDVQDMYNRLSYKTLDIKDIV